MEAQESDGSEIGEAVHSASSNLTSKLEALFDSSLLDVPPARSKVEQVLDEIAGSLAIDDSSLQYDEEGVLVSGAIEVEGTGLRGKLLVDGKSARISIPIEMTEQSHFFARAIDVSLVIKDGSVQGGRAVIQHHPNTLGDAPAPPAGHDPFVCGWTLSTGVDDGAFVAIEAQYKGMSQGWSIGRLGHFKGESYPGYSRLDPFDRIYSRLSPKWVE